MTSTSRDLSALTTVRDLVRWGASRFTEAGLAFGHGTDNALDEAFHLVLHALHLPADVPAIYLEAHVTISEREEVVALLERRFVDRVPAAYLIGRILFCGLEFKVSPDVLIPRSPIGEMIEARFSPWIDEPPQRVLDLCTGSGCIGIACAWTFPEAQVDISDVDAAALKVARSNIAQHGCEDQVTPIQSDLFNGLKGAVYDLIVTNPPYVPAEEWRALPDEYHHEPRLALEAGDDGMDLVERILREAPEHLAPGGLLVCEIGGSQEEFDARFPGIPVIWPEFSRGGDGVFLISREALKAWLDATD